MVSSGLAKIKKTIALILLQGVEVLSWEDLRHDF